jgi:hypothetical protein
MKQTPLTLIELFQRLRSEQLTSADEHALDSLFEQPAPQPWYVRVLVGFGAWLASLLLIGFIASMGIISGGGVGFIGVAFIVGATVIRRHSDGDFLSQCAMASSLAGQALLAYTIADGFGQDNLEGYLVIALAINATLFFIYPDHIHRVLMLLLATTELTSLLYLLKANALIPILGPLLAGALVLLMARLPALAGGGFSPLIAPLTNGLMLSAFGTLLLSTIYLLPELGAKFLIYPNPWISTLLLGAVLFHLGNRVWRQLGDPTDQRGRSLFNSVLLLIIASAWYAPGLILGLIVLMLGVQHGRHTFIGAGIGFFALFLAAFFYGIEVSLLTKSVTLIGCGLAILTARWIMLRLFIPLPTREADHA